ncbi:MAG: hypothetical protein GY936_05980 [Ignavibacteriae bacterium]|nr:hypothetical protein [Ignavibacteriota bacterium]
MKKIIVLVSLIVFVVGCASCNKVDKQDKQKNNGKRVLKQPVQPRLSPGTVLIEATILEIRENSNSLFIKVDKVIESGHSTPVLAVGEKINVKSKNKKFNDQIKKNTSLKMVLKNYKQKIGAENSNDWSLINIK